LGPLPLLGVSASLLGVSQQFRKAFFSFRHYGRDEPQGFRRISAELHEAAV
jgi:hypothetical protein